jgi:hypothetical protein
MIIVRFQDYSDEIFHENSMTHATTITVLHLKSLFTNLRPKKLQFKTPFKKDVFHQG